MMIAKYIRRVNECDVHNSQHTTCAEWTKWKSELLSMGTVDMGETRRVLLHIWPLPVLLPQCKLIETVPAYALF